MNVFLVIHTEKVGDPKVRKKMLDFGRSLQGKIRPVAAVTTPLSVVYEGSNDFADSLKELDRYFDIQMHGHYRDRAASNFQNEYDLLCKVGFKPSAYAGGWWIMNEIIAGQLDRNGFKWDTTINNKGVDSFGNPQSLPTHHKFMEVPTWRDFKMPRIWVTDTCCVSIHDFDLLNPSLRGKLWIHEMKRKALASKVKSFEEI